MRKRWENGNGRWLSFRGLAGVRARARAQG